jgi:hypothetical protein
VKPDSNLTPEQLAAWSTLLSAAARHLLKSDDLPTFADWAKVAVPVHLREMGMLPAGQAVSEDEAALTCLMGRALHAAMPLPSRRYRPIKLALPERNEPCLCGSGRKFKHCCAPLVPGLPSFPPELCIGPVLRGLGKAGWAVLPQSHIQPGMVMQAAVSWMEDGHVGDAAAVLAHWLPKEGPIADDRAELLDLLGDLYADLDKPRKRKELAQAMVARGGKKVQAKGWQRLCAMAADAGKPGEAAEAFKQAQRCDPEDPNLALLDMSVLIGGGSKDLLKPRAAFWAQRLARQNRHGELNDLIEHVLDMGERGGEAHLDAIADHEPELAVIKDWLDALPPPKLRLQHSPHATPDDLGLLAPSRELARALEDWGKVFDIAVPDLTGLHSNDPEPWRYIGAWLTVLQRSSELGDSFDVLDGLILLLDTHPSEGAVWLALALEKRGIALWAQLKAQHPKAQVAWGFMGNRPALRLLARHIAEDSSPRADNSFDWLRDIVEVRNPNDNHGFRELLMMVYLRRAMVMEALVLAARYPQDGDAMQMLHARAAWAAGERGQAISLMRAVFAQSSHMAKVWRSSKRPNVKQTEFVTYRSEHEAKLVYSEQFDLWQDAELRQTVMAISKGLA